MNPSIADKETSRAGNILIVDDTLANLRLLSDMLVEQGYKVRLAPNGKLALMGVQAVPPDLILLDIKMPGLSGYEVCEELKADPRTCDIPVTFISALDAIQDKVYAFKADGVDYVTKFICHWWFRFRSMMFQINSAAIRLGSSPIRFASLDNDLS